MTEQAKNKKRLRRPSLLYRSKGGIPETVHLAVTNFPPSP
jgi:hypothetical protein